MIRIRGTKDIERNAGFFLVASFLAMMLSFMAYDGGMSAALAALAVSIASAVSCVLSVILSRKGAERRAKTWLVAGTIGVYVSIVLIVLAAVLYVSEHSN